MLRLRGEAGVDVKGMIFLCVVGKSCSSEKNYG